PAVPKGSSHAKEADAQPNGSRAKDGVVITYRGTPDGQVRRSQEAGARVSQPLATVPAERLAFVRQSVGRTATASMEAGPSAVRREQLAAGPAACGAIRPAVQATRHAWATPARSARRAARRRWTPTGRPSGRGPGIPS